MIILSFNCGSSSVKYQLYNWGKQEIIAKGIVERVTIDPKTRLSHSQRSHKVDYRMSCSSGIWGYQRLIRYFRHRP